jgi:hypothetical protein
LTTLETRLPYQPRYERDNAMSLLAEPQNPVEIGDQLRNAYAVTAEFLSDIIRQTCRCFPSTGQSGKTARIEQLIQSDAWTDAALALIDLELPQWQLRRIIYDEGEWHCALSRERELPDWLDQSAEGRHADLTLAILSAFVEAQCISASGGRTSVPVVPRKAHVFYEPILSDNFA